MKISLKWMSRYLDVSEFFEEPDRLSAILTRAGLEVEDVVDHREQFKNVVIGNILEKGQHPDADKLSLCQVTTGQGVVHQIVCGAKNHKKGDNVVVALPGAVLPGNFAIKKSKIRGVESSGMLCSEVELGLAEESPGIMILDSGAPVGQRFDEFIGLDDIVFDLSVTANRADCLSHFGLARELGCLLDRQARLPEENISVVKHTTSAEVKLEVVNQDLCPRYAGRFIAGVNVGPSPGWLKQSLEAVGMNSINNIVDVTNFVMLELGQPLHAFDADVIADRKITVAMAETQEKFKTLDSTEIELDGSELMIRDGEKPVALAGVVGGLNSGVTEDTVNLFIESAYFSMASVRKTARKFGIETESGYRFSRGVDPEGTVRAMNRACQLIQEVAGGDIYSDPYDNYPQPIETKIIEIESKFVEQKLGFDVSATDFASWMQRLGCEVKVLDEGKFAVVPPAFRGDLEADVDLVEEYGRLVGYENIPEVFPNFDYMPAHHDKKYLLDKTTRTVWAGLGYQQAVNYAFMAEAATRSVSGEAEKYVKLGLNVTREPVKILNPLSEDVNVMKASLLPGLLKNLAHNDRHESRLGQIFELGHTFSGEDGGEYAQEKRLALAAWGEPRELWQRKCPLVLRVKSDIELFLRSLQSQSWRWETLEADEVPSLFHPGQSAALFYEGRRVGVLGTLHPKVAREHKVRTEAVIAEFNADSLYRGQPRTPKSKSLAKFPPVERDLAFVVPNELAVANIVSEMRKAGGKALQMVEVFDVYTGEHVAEGKRSVAFRLVYQDSKETLSDDKVSGLQEKLINSVSQKFSIQVR